MVRKREEIEELIALYLSGESSPEQAMDLDDWRAKSPENRTLYEQYEKTYTSTHGTTAFKSPDLEAAWKKVNSALTKEAKVVPLFKNKNFIMSVAAVGLVAFIIGSMWNFNPEQQKPEVAKITIKKPTQEDKERIIQASNNVESYTLSDKSIVELGAGSTLILAKDYDKNGRNAELKGSGRFTVIHDETNPFILKVGELDVFDVGTVFDVKTSGDTVKVVVTEGAVELRLNGKTLDVAEGDSAYYLISKQLISRYKLPKQRLDKVFEFDDVELSDIMDSIGAFFGRKIVIKDEAIKACTLKLTFKDETLPMILDIIKLAIDIEIIYNNKIIEVYGKGCE